MEPSRTLRRFAAALLAWSALALFFGLQYRWMYAESGRPIGWGLAFATSFLEWYGWGALSPAILFLARRFPIERGRALRNLGLHLGAAALAASLHIVAVQGVIVATDLWAEWERRYGYSFGFTREHLLGVHVMRFHWNALVYLGLVALAHARQYQRSLRERELRASQLEAQLAQAQLQALRMQLQPHFLFNALNTIAALIPSDAEAAERMVERLAELLRTVLGKGAGQLVPLRDELRFLDGYLEIEQARFLDRLSVEREVDPATLEARVPSLILQPLVENAVRHGIAPRPEPGRVTIRARRERETLVLEVRDTGPGLAAPDARGAGLGLPNTRDRLEKLYGAGFRLDLESAAGTGLGVVLRIPYAEAG